AVWVVRLVVIFGPGLQVLGPWSYISVLEKAVGRIGSMPPTTIILPSGSSVAVWPTRFVLIRGPGLQLGKVASLAVSYIWTVEPPAFPPARRTLPFCNNVAVGGA